MLFSTCYYYDRSNKCYRKKRKKCDCDCHCEPRYQTLTSGPLFRNSDTDFIQVSALNRTDEPQIVIIAVQNYQDTCVGDVFPSYRYLCWELINNDNGGSDDDVGNKNGNGGCIYCEPEGVTTFIGPFTFTIPPQQLFSLRVFAPQEPIFSQDPIYVVRVTQPVNPVIPTDAALPLDLSDQLS